MKIVTIAVALRLLAFLGVPAAVRADEPWLAVRLAGGESACYPVSQVDRVGFAGDTLFVAGAGGSQNWAVDTITKIELLWDPATSASPQGAAGLLKALQLFQNQPNPFSPVTRIAFDLPQAGKASLEIFGPDGRLVRTLVTGERPAGRQEVCWDGLDDAGRRAAGGVYFYSLRAAGNADSRRMVLLP